MDIGCCGSRNFVLFCFLFFSQLSSSSPQYGQAAIHGQDMHSEMEMYASRLAEAEQRQRAMSTPDLLVCNLLGMDTCCCSLVNDTDSITIFY